MRKFWLVAKHEYVNMVRRRAFVLGTLGIPALIAAIVVLSIWLADGGPDTRPLGYVDEAGLMTARASLAADEAVVEIRPYDTQAHAQADLMAGQIQAYYVLPEDYLQTGDVQLLYAQEPPDGSIQADFKWLLRANLLDGQQENVQQRVLDGIALTLRSADGRREFSETGFLNILLPFAAGFFFLFSVLSSSGYLLQAITTEKENRTVEIMATSLSPVQLMGGKSIGLIAVAFTQLLVWITAMAVALAVAARFWEPVRQLDVSGSLLMLMLLYYVPSYVLVTGIMITIGSAVADQQQGQQFTGIVNLLFIVPFFFAVLFLTNPDGPLAVALTLFPTTAFLTVTMRWAVTVVPTWQLLASWLILVATAAFSISVASRVYRVGMLRYGQRLDMESILASLRNTS